MAAAAARDKIVIHHHVFVHVHGPHVAGVAQQVVVDHQPPPPDQFRRGCRQPQAVADDTLDDRSLAESPFQELHRRREPVDILGVTQAVGHHPGRDDQGGITPQGVVVHPLERSINLDRDLVFMTFEAKGTLSPEPGQQMDLGPLFGKTEAVVPDFRLIPVRFHQNGDLFSLQLHRKLLL